MKLFVSLFALLSIQGCLSAPYITEKDILDLVDQFQLDDLSFLDYVPMIVEALFDDDYLDDAGNEAVAYGDPANCVPYIQEAYNNALEVKRIITEGRGLGKKVYEDLLKCKSLPSVDEKKKCAREAVKKVIESAKSLIQAFKAVVPKLRDSMEKFAKCLA